MKKILLTGATGFIGKNLLKNYQKKYKFYVLLRNKKKNKKFLIKNKNLVYLFFEKNSQIKKLIKKYEVNFFINLATHYTSQNDTSSVQKIIESNILFPSVVISSINKSKLEKIINIGTMHEHFQNKDFFPYNFYASSKRSFEVLIEYFKQNLPVTKFYNLKFYETYSNNDVRDKIIPNIKKKYKKNKIFKLHSKDLTLNFLHIDDVLKGIEIIITNKIKQGNYLIKSNIFTNIRKLINSFNRKNKKKIKLKIMNNKFSKIKFPIKLLPFWKQNNYIENDFEKIIND